MAVGGIIVSVWMLEYASLWAATRGASIASNTARLLGLQKALQKTYEKFQRASMSDAGHRFLQAYEDELQLEAQTLLTEGPSLPVTQQASMHYLDLLQQEQQTHFALNQLNTEIRVMGPQLSEMELAQLRSQQNELQIFLQDIQKSLGINN